MRWAARDLGMRRQPLLNASSYLPRFRIAAVSFTALALTVLEACDARFLGTACTDELRVDLQPAGEQQIAVGGGFSPRITLSTCGGRERLSDTFTWSARDTVVARVDPGTGRVTGRSPGSTAVDVRGTRYGAVGTIPVVVR